ncbi:MAG TPA: hypothetical protein VE591_11170, partial [Candidatus Acidoferrum sp.]|nr:hypothetical protein [Candidatus Acidoferrum sp.]
MTTHGGAIGDVLQAPNAPIEAIWFPLSGMVSTLRPLENDGMVEVDAAGAEGFVGLEVIMGMPTTVDTWMVQSPGRFARLDAPFFIDTMEREPSLREAARRYAASVMAVRG